MRWHRLSTSRMGLKPIRRRARSRSPRAGWTPTLRGPVFCALLLSAVLFTGARAHPLTDLTAWFATHPCGVSVTVTATLVDDVAAMAMAVRFPGQGNLPPFVLANLPPPELGLILFTKSGDGWRAFPIEEGGLSQGVFIAPAQGRFAVISMLSREGPGQRYVLAQSGDALKSMRCTHMPFPKALNKARWANEFLSLDDFNIDEKGRATLIASALVERQGREQIWRYRYNSKDGGLTWSAPERLGPRAPRPLGGLFTPWPVAAPH